MASSESQTGTPWVERYRPKSLDEVSHQAEIVATLKNSVATGRLPHLLFYGPPGSGKVCHIVIDLYLLVAEITYPTTVCPSQTHFFFSTDVGSFGTLPSIMASFSMATPCLGTQC
jgi:hypothetical protein